MGMNREQVKKINEKAGNNFKFDTQFYMFHKEKQLEKNIWLDDKSYLRATLYFGTYFVRKENDWGQKFNVPTQKSVITLRISKYSVNEDGTAVSYGLGYKFEEEEIYERKMFNNICKISHSEKYTDENILRLYNEKIEEDIKRVKKEVEA